MKKLLILSLVLMVTGCAYFPMLKLEKGKREVVAKAENFYVVHEDAPEAEGVISGKQELNEKVRIREQRKERIQIASPAEEIEQILVKNLLKQKQDLNTVSFKDKMKPTDVALWLRDRDITEGVLLDVALGGWGIEPRAEDRTKYLAWINAQMTLRDLGKDEVLAQYTCYSDTLAVPIKDAPTKYAILKDNGALAKKMFSERAKACAKEMIERTLSDEKPS